MRCRLCSLGVVVLWLGSAIGQGPPLAAPVPDAALPFAVTTPPPAWLVPGTRLTFKTIAGTIPASDHDFEVDPEGRWADAEGNRYRRIENAGTGSAGWLLANVLALDHKQVGVQLLFYLWNGLDPTSSTESMELGYVTNAGCGGDLWLHPDALRRLQQEGVPGLVVRPMDYTLGRVTYHALWLFWPRQQGRSVWIYDRDSGVLLYTSDISKGGGRHTQHGVQLSEGATTLRCTTFEASRQIVVPWAKVPAPAVVKAARGFDYRGQLTVRPVAVDTPMPFRLDYDVVQRSGDWLLARLRAPDLIPGMDLRVRSAHQLTGLWIPPEHCAQLQLGQVLDRDPIVGTTVSVGYVDADSVTLVQQGPRQEFRFTYRKGDGLLARGQFTEQLPITPGAPVMSRVVNIELSNLR